MLVNITIPVYNEEKILKENIQVLYTFLNQNLDYPWEVVIADNGSNDQTQKIAKNLVRKLDHLKYLRLKEKGRGRALRKAWQESKAEILSYMDADLAVDLFSFPKLVQVIKQGADIAIGSRFIPNSQVQRSKLRKILSWSYNKLIRFFFKVEFKDGQCGFKAISKKVLENIIPQVKDNHWFFDTEMLVLAEKEGYKIKEIPVKWIEKRNKYRKSKVKIISTILGYLFSILKLKLRLLCLRVGKKER